MLRDTQSRHTPCLPPPRRRYAAICHHAAPRIRKDGLRGEMRACYAASAARYAVMSLSLLQRRAYAVFERTREAAMMAL